MRATSPDGQHDLVAFRVECGAATRESYHVSILPAEEPVGGEGGNVFVAELERGPIVQIIVAWKADTAQVAYNAPREVFKQEPTAASYPVEYLVGDGIDIVY